MYVPPWPSLNPAYFIKSDAAGNMPYPLNSASKAYFYVARNGIYHLMRSLGLEKGGTVLAPDYHHGNEIYAMRAAGARIQYYPVRKNLDVDLDAVAKLCEGKPRVLYVTHFIGWPQPMAELQALCRRHEITLIEDCALSFMSELNGKALGSFGDYSVFCLYKTLPVPNGGVLAANNTGKGSLDELSLHPCSRMSVTGRNIELMLQWLRSRYETAGRALFAMKRTAGRMLSAGHVRRVPVGDTGFDLSSVNIGMSPICHSLLRRFQYNWIKETRRRNFMMLQERLQGAVALMDKSLSDGVCPLFFPLLVKDKGAAAQALSGSGIEAIQFWNNGDPEMRRQGTDAGFLRRHLLEVPIHQDVTPAAVDYMADRILQLQVGLPA